MWPDIYGRIESCVYFRQYHEHPWSITKLTWVIIRIQVPAFPPSPICTNNWTSNRTFAVDPFLAHMRINNNQRLNWPHRAALRGTFCPCNLPTTNLHRSIYLFSPFVHRGDSEAHIKGPWWNAIRSSVAQRMSGFALTSSRAIGLA